ncbi:MAG: MazE family transcriptional regulator [Cyclonatronaceae bacterium]
MEKALLALLKVDDDDSVEVIPHENGLLIKKVDAKSAYEQISRKRRKSLDKLAE